MGTQINAVTEARAIVALRKSVLKRAETVLCAERSRLVCAQRDCDEAATRWREALDAYATALDDAQIEISPPVHSGSGECARE